MKFADIPAGTAVFVDANPLVYHFAPEPVLGPACCELLDRIARGEIAGFTSSHVLSNVAHRLMTIEAMTTFGWVLPGIARRLQQHPSEVQTLAAFRRAIEAVPSLGVQVVDVTLDHVLSAAQISQHHGLLSGDALVVAVMRSRGITHLASHDADFDRLTDLVRYSPD